MHSLYILGNFHSSCDGLPKKNLRTIFMWHGWKSGKARNKTFKWMCLNRFDVFLNPLQRQTRIIGAGEYFKSCKLICQSGLVRIEGVRYCLVYWFIFLLVVFTMCSLVFTQLALIYCVWRQSFYFLTGYFSHWLNLTWSISKSYKEIYLYKNKADSSRANYKPMFNTQKWVQLQHHLTGILGLVEGRNMTLRCSLTKLHKKETHRQRYSYVFKK